MPAKHICVTEDESLRYFPNAARETQVHQHEDAIHRLMPPNRIIGFSVDKSSFRQGGVPDKVTYSITKAAGEVASAIADQDLGIKFAYRPNSASNVFDIRFDPKLGHGTLARSFFPSDPRTSWELGISTLLAFSGPDTHYMLHLRNILAHEFAHILGLRHWNADTREASEPSFHWPNTEKGSRTSVMNTIQGEDDLKKMWFSEEDFRVIKEIYFLKEGKKFAGRNIVDVDPWNWYYMLSWGVRRGSSLVTSLIVFERKA